MRGPFRLTPLLLLSTACAARPDTPLLYNGSDHIAAEPPPPSTQTVLPTYTEAVSAWQLPPNNVWAPYCKQTLLAALEDTRQSALMPDVRELGSVKTAASAAAALAAAGLPQDTMWVVDLRGAASVAFGTFLSGLSAAPVSVVPTFNNWPAQNELVPAEETLSALVMMRPRQPDLLQTSTRPVFLLDAWRLAFRDEQPDDRVVDNRYALTMADLPSPEVLAAQGIRRVAYVIEDRGQSGVEEDDLNALFVSYQRAGIAVDLIDLAQLFGLAPQGMLDPLLANYVYLVSPRITLMEDASFYRRSHGGFGGIYARPTPYRFGTNFTGGAGGGGGYRGG